MKKFKMEYLLYIFIIIAPLLDASSYLFKLAFPTSSITPTLIIRPIIPLVVLLYIFIKDKKYRLPLVISAFIYVLYGIIHLLITKSLIMPISVGGIFQEAQYIINYTYMVYLLFIFLYFKNEKNIIYLKKSLMISLIIYLFIIYFSILTNTSAPTYVEGIGYRSYFVSGNSLCTTLLMLICVLLTNIKENKVLNIILYTLTGIFLIFLVGTRTGMLGFLLVTFIYIGLLITSRLLTKKFISPKVLLTGICVLFILVLSIGIFGSETITRRIHIRNETGIIDVNTERPGYTTGDTSMFVYKIRNKELEENYMTKEQEKAYLSMYKYANKKKLKSTDLRKQQLIYNLYLVKHQHNLIYIIFGNGFLVNYGEMRLEMEAFTILLNFGLIGFILYLIPFIYIYIKLVKDTLKTRKKDINNIMYLIMMLIVFGLSFMAGYVFFSSTCSLMLISLMTLVYRKD